MKKVILVIGLMLMCNMSWGLYIADPTSNVNLAVNDDGSINVVSSGASASTVNIGNSPTVVLSGTSTVNIGNTPAVTISGTPAVSISGTPTVNIGNSLGYAMSSTINTTDLTWQTHTLQSNTVKVGVFTDQDTYMGVDTTANLIEVPGVLDYFWFPVNGATTVYLKGVTNSPNISIYEAKIQ